MRWYEKPPVLDYIVSCYAGVDQENGRVRRQFIWETNDGDLVIGNSRAFSEHLSQRFGLELKKTAWMCIHELLRALGEVAQTHSPRMHHPGRKFKNQQPRLHVLRRKSRS